MKKPTTLMVLGILNICFAGMGLMGGLFGLVSPFLPIPGMEIYAGAYKDGTFLAIVLGLIGVGLLSKLAMLVSGVGLVKGRAWGRSLGNGWAVFSIVYGLTAVAVAGLYTMPAMDDAVTAFVAQHPGTQTQAVQQHQMTHGVMLASTVVMGLAQAVIYQVLFLIMINRQAVRDYLASSGGRAAGAGPGAETAGKPEDAPW